VQGLRISEVADGRMGDFFRRVGADGQEQWWLNTLGKGDKARTVSVSGELLQELRRYRLAHGLPAVPAHSDDTPLLLPLRGPARGLSRSAVHDAIKAMFAGAAVSLRSRGAEFADRADELERASAQWLRHTAGSHQADGGVDLRTVRDNLGHASLVTTSLYLHVDDDRRHRETGEKHRIDW
jgi:site-specific recombinase XerD